MKIGIFLSVLWLIVVLALPFLLKQTPDTTTQWFSPILLERIPNSANEWGDYFAGFVAPLALVWFVATLYLQRRELSYQGRQLELQRQEMKLSREALEEQSSHLLRAAAAAETSAKTTERMSTAPFYTETFRRYDELGDTMTFLGSWKESKESQAARAKYLRMNPEMNYRSVLKETPLRGDVRKSCRDLKMYFLEIYRLYKFGVIDEDTTRNIIDVYGFALLEHVVKPADIHVYFLVRQQEPKEITSESFRSEFKWYEELSRIRRRHSSVPAEVG